VYFRNAEGRIIAALCVNYDVSVLQQASGLIQSLLPLSDDEQSTAPNEFMGRDLPTVMDAMVTEAIREVGRPVDAMTREDRMSVLLKLDQQGATQMRKGIENIAARLGISRVTAYAYLDEARSQGQPA
jgi:predicted transcriptional regulator YheO